MAVRLSDGHRLRRTRQRPGVGTEFINTVAPRLFTVATGLFTVATGLFTTVAVATGLFTVVTGLHGSSLRSLWRMRSL